MAVLGLLKDRTMHGYELKKELTATLGQFWQVSYGSLYPTIRRLEMEGAVERIFPKADVVRRKNIYRITAKGEEMFTEALREPSAVSDDARFGVKLAFFRYLNPDARVEVLERRRDPGPAPDLPGAHRRLHLPTDGARARQHVEGHRMGRPTHRRRKGGRCRTGPDHAVERTPRPPSRGRIRRRART